MGGMHRIVSNWTLELLVVAPHFLFEEMGRTPSLTGSRLSLPIRASILIESSGCLILLYINIVEMPYSKILYLMGTVG